MNEAIEIPFEDIEQRINESLTGINRTLGLAESCTGGRIADKLTQIPGTAGYFQGSIVCYQNTVKEDILNVSPETIRKYHVVSEPVAIEMAEGAKRILKADYGFGITGLLGPDDDGDLPAGTICMAVTDGEQTISATYHFHHDRPGNKEIAARTGMLMIWKFIHKKL